MKVVSLDIESTGLDVDKDQILQIAAVVDTYETGVPQPHLKQLPTFCQVVKQGRVSGHPAAMAMNAGLLGRIARGEGDYLSEVIRNLTGFLHSHAGDGPAVIAGKNVWKLDLAMIRNAGYEGHNFIEDRVHHRALDPTTLYTDPYTDKVAPSMRECLTRAGIGNVPWAMSEHDPVDDCLKVLALLRHKWSKT